MNNEQHRIIAEIAHVLFMDLVEHSLLSIEEQARITGELRGVVKSSPEFISAESHGDLISLDTGDGMALVFFRDPVAPIQCAVEITTEIAKRPYIRLRMGIHSGPVSRITDINGKENVSGSGINIAQRVMDCGDESHILLSARYAEDLIQFETWASSVVDLGECAVKHGVRIHIYNFTRGTVGNSNRPTSLERRQESRGHHLTTPIEPVHSAPMAVILYKRGAHPDEEIVGRLEIELQSAGIDVFTDRHLAVGVEWAREIDHQIRNANAVIPLLSSASIHSEMLEHEVLFAHETAATSPREFPQIFPIRVCCAEILPDRVGAVLNPLQQFEWSAPEDTNQLVHGLVRAIHSNGAGIAPTAMTRDKLEPVGGAVPLNSQFYIVRPTDEEFRAAITRRDSIVLVKGARQMGKTSLLARGMQQAREQGARVVLTDFQTLNASHLASADSLFRTLADILADQLDLDVLPSDTWNPGRGPNMNLERFIRREVFGSIDQPIVWGLDEVDRLFSCDYGSEVFGLFRSWHNKRALDPGGPWSKLTLAIAYATEAHLFIKDLNQSPFNVGTRLSLADFTIEETSELHRRYQSPLRTQDDVKQFHNLLGGQPYLVRRGLDELALHPTDIRSFEADALRDEGIYGDHLRRILVTISQDPDMTRAVRAVLSGTEVDNPSEFYRLRSTGILTGDSTHDARMRCQLYQQYLSRHLIN